MQNLTPEIIDFIKSQNNIVDLISDRIALKQSGNEFKGLCPFHNEKTPSFGVNSEKQVYHCYGCGASGDIVTFVTETESLTFRDAIVFLAQRASIEIPEDDSEYAQKLKELNETKSLMYEVNAIAVDHFQIHLNESVGLDFILSRGINSEFIELFRLGYATSDWQLLVDRYNPVQLEVAKELGLIGEKENRYYDVFRDRVMIPIFDKSENVIGFGGRLIKDSKEAKYINSKESLIFKKNSVLFGINLARKSIKKNDNVFVTEGYFDVINLHQLGINNVVACMGTALNSNAVNQIRKLTNNITLNFDSDEPGQNAINRTIEDNKQSISNELINLNVLKLKGVKDAGELTPDNANQYTGEIKSSNWIDWSLNRLLSQKSLENQSDLKAIAYEMRSLLAIIDGHANHPQYLSKMAQILCNKDMSRFDYYLSYLKSNQSNLLQEKPSNTEELNPLKQAEYYLLLAAAIANKVVGFDDFSHTPYQEIYRIIRTNRLDWYQKTFESSLSDEAISIAYSLHKKTCLDIELVQDADTLVKDAIAFIKKHQSKQIVLESAKISELCQLQSR